ncbi:armadillo-type protein [Fimicolochytrium jonesii]|uniref:armadillo-type protein n=1 Tax=Fimicolochytrium jonesii TaxID=1396493 RepID=UPI0022FE3E33|nr:armadillo-type protein [Fimicolochytrium jonesii]KAI8824031.1 armadillo-type protein [Fimicolochytrium jonesii]
MGEQGGRSSGGGNNDEEEEEDECVDVGTVLKVLEEHPAYDLACSAFKSLIADDKLKNNRRWKPFTMSKSKAAVKAHSKPGGKAAKTEKKVAKKEEDVNEDFSSEGEWEDQDAEEGNEDAMEVDGEGEGFDEEGEGDESDGEGEGEDEDEDNEDGGEEAPAVKKQRTAEEEEKIKQSRAEQKATQAERKAAKPNAPLIQNAKAIWEKLRQKKITAKERKEQMAELMTLIEGKVKDIIFKHDASRIIQCALKYGNQSQRDAIAKELEGHYTELSKSTYGRFIISKILNYCSPQYRALVVKDFYGKIRKLVRHKEAAVILEEAYVMSNAQQRSRLLEEFYGPEFALWKNAGGHTIESLIADNPVKKDSVVRHLREVLNSVLEKGFTNIGHLTIVHRALLEYLTFAEEKHIKDMIELLKDHLVQILHTREGARVAQLCLLHATPKDRKLIVKSFKTFVTKIAREQYGHAVLLSVFECVDDTVLVEKAIIGELIAEAEFADLLRDRYASRVVLFLLMGRNRRIQPAYVINELESMDEIRARTSKKDDTLRREQLVKAISPALVKTCEESCAELVRDGNGGPVVVETVFHAEGDKSTLITAITSLAAGTDSDSNTTTPKSDEPFHPVKQLKADADAAKQLAEGLEMSQHVLINRQSTYVLKDIISPRAPRVKSTTASSTPSEPAAASPETTAISQQFAAALVKVIEPNVGHWLTLCAHSPRNTSGTAFIFVALLERGDDATKKIVTGAVKKQVKGGVDGLRKVVSKALEASVDEKEAGKRKRGKEGVKKEGERTTGIEVFLKTVAEA